MKFQNIEFIDRKYRKLILILFDLSISILTFIIITNFSENINLNEIEKLEYLSLSIIFSTFIYLTYLFLGIYKTIVRYSSFNIVAKIYLANFISLLSFYTFFRLEKYNFSIFEILLIYFLISTFTCLYRITFRHFYKRNKLFLNDSFKKIVIYGAGSAGAKLYSALEIQDSIKITAFVDDDPKLWGLDIENIKIYSPNDIKILKEKKLVHSIILALPSIKNYKKLQIIENLKNYEIPVLQVPSLKELIENKKKINTLKRINFIDLLGRDQVEPNADLLKKNITNKSVLVTGAGGSIGQELCRQILKLNPKKLVILDASEVSLYQIDNQLSSIINNGNKIKLITILGCCTNRGLIEETLSSQNINIIFHAAAYKHVPLIEINPIIALKNNLVSTVNLCSLSLKYGVDKFVLISSDKAVRPTNLMGASKRLSELIIKRYSSKNLLDDRNQNQNFKTLFSSVRFGNVLGSSGSVVPLFEKQIYSGGPVTLTHPEITRFFMTIEEAAELVIQSTSLSNGGDIFLLEMGDPVKILDLAKKMISLSGQTIKDSKNKNGDIEIIFTGLRKGEKLFEELLINDMSETTNHPLIFKEIEDYHIADDFDSKLNKLFKHIESFDQDSSINLLSKLVPEWKISKHLKN